MRFTDKGIRGLKPRSSRYEIYSDNEHGFGLRVAPAGIKTFISRYRRPDGQLVKITIGRYQDGFTLADARAQHGEYRRLIEKKIDPRELIELEKAEARAEVEQRKAEIESDTVKGLADRFIKKWAMKHHKTAWPEDKRILEKDVVPAWGDRKAKDITRRDVIGLMEDIEARGAPVVANHTYGILKQMFDYALDRDIIDTTPCVRIKRHKETPRDRVLSEKEIRSFWDTLDNMKAHKSIKAALKFLLVTGQRRGEIVGASWAEFEGDWWTIPASRTKNETAHRVPLTKTALSLLDELRELAEGSPWVMPSPVKKTTPITPRALTRSISNNRALFDMPSFSVHDLRRSAISMMRSNPRIRNDVPRVVNHTPQDITSRVYDLYAYDDEKRHALTWWERKLKTILQDKQDNVVVAMTGTA